MACQAVIFVTRVCQLAQRPVQFHPRDRGEDRLTHHRAVLHVERVAQARNDVDARHRADFEPVPCLRVQDPFGLEVRIAYRADDDRQAARADEGCEVEAARQIGKRRGSQSA